MKNYPTPLEKDTQKLIIEWLELRGFYAVRVNSGALLMENGNGKKRMIRLGKQGTPDILACVNGAFVGIEVKRDDAKIKAWRNSNEARDVAQRESMERIKTAGGYFIIASSLDEVEADIGQIETWQNEKETKSI